MTGANLLLKELIAKLDRKRTLASLSPLLLILQQADLQAK